MTTNTTDHIRFFTRCWDQTRAIAAAVTPEDLDRPTPCTEFDVRQLLHHIASGGLRAAHVGNGGHFAEVATITSGFADDELVTRVDRAGADAIAAWSAPGRLDGTYTVPWGTVPGLAVLGGYAQEVLIHGWDLAQAIGDGAPLDPELATEILPVAQMVLPADGRGPEVPFGAVVEVPDDADPYLRLAGWLGRRPLVSA